MKGADRIVLAEGVGVVAATTISSFAQGQGFPAPKVFLGGAAMFGGLVLLARPAPAFAVSLGALVVVYGLLRASKPDGKSVGEILVESVTGIGTGGFEAPGSGKTSQPSSIGGAAAAAALATPASAAVPASTGTAPAVGATRANPAGGAGGTGYTKPLATAWTRLGGVAAHAGGGRGGVDNWESSNAVDLGVPQGTPVLAVADGVIGPSFGFNTLGGNRLHLVTSGNEFYYAHLSGYAPGIAAGTRVRAGQVLGYASNTGDAAGGPVHLHFAAKVGNPETIVGY